MDALTHQQHRLILAAFSPSIEVILPADLRRPDRPNREQFFQPLMNLRTPRQRIENAPRIRQLLAHVLLSRRAV